MSLGSLPLTLPRALDYEAFFRDPIDFLSRAREIHGNCFVVKDGGPVFSHSSKCAGAIAVFGSENLRAVLSDIDTFGIPKSPAHSLKLPKKLINLNRSLHSMQGNEHAVQRRQLMELLHGGVAEATHDHTCAAIDDFLTKWKKSSQPNGLLHQMRQLVLQSSSLVLFGNGCVDSTPVTLLLQAYFKLRREASSPTVTPDSESAKQILTSGKSLDTALRKFVRKCRGSGDTSSNGLLGRLANLKAQSGEKISEDEIIGHSNIFFVSSTEPIAVALTWIFLILSQMPALRSELSNELLEYSRFDSFPTIRQLGSLPLLDQVINESLRLFPPNAFMVRTTTRPIVLNDARLPSGCEVILCPFISNRNEKVFLRANEFRPNRWKVETPSPFDYFPFGAGGHSCVGRGLALYMIKVAMVSLLQRYEVVLAGDQSIDWRLNIMFMPSDDPSVNLRLKSEPYSELPGKLNGPIGDLLKTAENS